MSATSTEVSIRAAVPADLVSVEQLLVDSFPEVFGRMVPKGKSRQPLVDVLVSLRMLHPEPVAGTVVAEYDGTIIGTMRLETAADQAMAPSVIDRLRTLRPVGAIGALRFVAAIVAADPGHRVAADEGHMRSAAVRPGNHSGGVGTRMLEHVVDHAHALGCARVTTLVLEDNAASIAMVHKVGFRPSETRKRTWRARLLRSPHEVLLVRDLP